MWFHKYGPCCTLSTCSLHSCLVDSLSAYLIFESQHPLEDMLQPCPDMYLQICSLKIWWELRLALKITQ